MKPSVLFMVLGVGLMLVALLHDRPAVWIALGGFWLIFGLVARAREASEADPDGRPVDTPPREPDDRAV